MKKVNGGWTHEDWSPRPPGTWEPLRKFCFDVRAERYEEIVIVVSNGDHHTDNITPKGGDRMRLGVNNIGCWRWKGTASSSISSSKPVGSTKIDVSAIDVVWERTGKAGALVFETYKLISGSFSASSSTLYSSGCRSSSQIANVWVLSQTSLIELPPFLQMQNYALSGMSDNWTGGMLLGGYHGFASSSAVAPFVIEPCQGSPGGTQPQPLGGIWFFANANGGSLHQLPKVRNGVMAETVVISIPGTQTTYTWKFEPQREP